jgi:hypothetical protein
MILIPSFIKIGSGIQKLLGGDSNTDRHTQMQQGDLISTLLFFQNRESRTMDNVQKVSNCI